jgi:hypothetical protein
MKATTTGLLTGLALGFAGYFGGFGAFVVVAVVGLAGLAAGYVSQHRGAAADYLHNRAEDLRQGSERRRGASANHSASGSGGYPTGSHNGHKVRVR